MNCHFLDHDGFAKAERNRMALGKARGADPTWLAANNSSYGWARIDEVVAPCAMWFVPWFFDPEDETFGPHRDRALKALQAGTFAAESFYLSRFYWSTWSHKRPPICVLTPNGKEWNVDSKSSNGEGWEVTGDVPKITCSPLIQVPGYHGFLRDGAFTPNQ